MRSRRLFGALAALILAFILWADPAPADLTAAAEIDAVFADYDTTATPGCSLGVMRDGQLIYKRGYGMANLEHGIALSSRSVFRTGSTGKQFTAMAIALLAEQGILSLDDPLRKLFPEFPPYADDITIRHLVHHTSGLRDYLTLAELAGLGESDRFSDEFAIELLTRQKRLNFDPGDQYLYSNSGYFLLSHVVRRATGQTLREFAAANIFEPLGMHNSHFHDDHTHIVPDRADGYAPTEVGFRISKTTLDMVGDGGVFTSVEELLLWDRNFYDNQLGKGGPALTELVTTPGRLNGGDALDYAFGLRVRDYRGLKMISHGGAFVGYRAEMIRFPDQRLSVAVLCNRADADPSQRARRVAELFLAGVLAPEEAPRREPTETTERVAVPVAELEGLAGHYWSAQDKLAREIRLQEGKLVYVRSRENAASELAPLGGDRFVMLEVPVYVEVRFEPVDSTRHRMIVRVADEEQSTFEPIDKRMPTGDELTPYLGRYHSEELDVDYVLSLQDGVLVFGVDRPGDHRLEPQFSETFTNPDYGTLEFERDAQGEVVGFSLGAGRVRGLEFVRQ